MQVLECMASYTSPQAQLSRRVMSGWNARTVSLPRRGCSALLDYSPAGTTAFAAEVTTVLNKTSRQQVGSLVPACPLFVQGCEKVTAFILSFLLPSLPFPGGGGRRGAKEQGKDAMNLIRGILCEADIKSPPTLLHVCWLVSLVRNPNPIVLGSLSGESRTHITKREELGCEIGITVWYAITLGWHITCHGLLGDFGDLAYSNTNAILLLHT